MTVVISAGTPTGSPAAGFSTASSPTGNSAIKFGSATLIAFTTGGSLPTKYADVNQT
jgi:hypothetical protein